MSWSGPSLIMCRSDPDCSLCVSGIKDDESRRDLPSPESGDGVRTYPHPGTVEGHHS